MKISLFALQTSFIPVSAVCRIDQDLLRESGGLRAEKRTSLSLFSLFSFFAASREKYRRQLDRSVSSYGGSASPEPRLRIVKIPSNL